VGRILPIACLILALAVPVFGAKYPPEIRHFPCLSYNLVNGKTLVASPQSLQLAKNEHYLLIFQLRNSQINNLRVNLTGPQGIPRIGYAPFQLRAAPATLSDLHYADALVGLDSGLLVQTELDVNYLVVQFHVRYAHPAGTYDYSLTIRDGTKVLVVPLQIQVWSFALTNDLSPTVEANCSYKTDWFGRYGVASESLPNVYRSYLAALRNYKINAVGGFAGSLAEMLVEGGRIEDYPEYTQMLAEVLTKYKFRYFRIPKLEDQYDARYIGTLGDLFSGVAPGYYRQWYDYLAPKGWANRALVKVWDEPTVEEYPNMLEAHRIIKNSVPGFLTETASGNVPTPEMVEGLNIFVSYFLNYLPGQDDALRDQGLKIWLYANRRHKILFPPTHQRAIGWYMFQYGFSGCYLWSVNYWNSDPWSTEPSAAGDFLRAGTFFYPHPTLGTPIPTLRLEALRRGFEDYQYLRLLWQAKVKKKIPAASWKEVQAMVAALTADWQEQYPQATWSDFEAVRIKIGTILNGLN
jgi:hypothetical protein